jgi:hypothetical protein
MKLNQKALPGHQKKTGTGKISEAACRVQDSRSFNNGIILSIRIVTCCVYCHYDSKGGYEFVH